MIDEELDIITIQIKEEMDKLDKIQNEISKTDFWFKNQKSKGIKIETKKFKTAGCIKKSHKIKRNCCL